MYRFSSIKEYDRRLDELTGEIWRLRRQRRDHQKLVEYEMLKLSYIIEKNDFIDDFFDIHRI